MRIIKPGKIAKYQYTCKNCGCVFEFDEKDINVVQEPCFNIYAPESIYDQIKGKDLLFQISKSVKCPQCELTIEFDDEFLKKIEVDN